MGKRPFWSGTHTTQLCFGKLPRPVCDGGAGVFCWSGAATLRAGNRVEGTGPDHSLGPILKRKTSGKRVTGAKELIAAYLIDHQARPGSHRRSGSVSGPQRDRLQNGRAPAPPANARELFQQRMVSLERAAVLPPPMIWPFEASKYLKKLGRNSNTARDLCGARHLAHTASVYTGPRVSITEGFRATSDFFAHSSADARSLTARRYATSIKRASPCGPQ